VGRYLSETPKYVKMATDLLSPEIAKRREMMRQPEYADDKPVRSSLMQLCASALMSGIRHRSQNDYLSWLMEDVAGDPVHDTDRDVRFPNAKDSSSSLLATVKSCRSESWV
jgi:hypothetical protein